MCFHNSLQHMLPTIEWLVRIRGMEKALDLFTNFLGYSCPKVMMSQATLLYFIFTVLRKYPPSQFLFTTHMIYVHMHTIPFQNLS